jgi:lipoprotein-anchoring transpeptidase ErfK/SrfK
MRTGAFLRIIRTSPPAAVGKGLATTALVAAALLLTGAMDTVEAQIFPWGGWQQGGSAPWQARPRRQRRAAPHFVEPKEKDPTSQLPKPKEQLLLVVSLKNQTVTVYDGLNKLATSPISSGMRGRETPTGIFSLLEKNRHHYSNLYGGAPMPYMERITNSGVALHAGQLPGYPASHGCIRMPFSFARKLFGITDIGARVIVTNEDLTPSEFHSANLIAPLPPGNDDGQAKTGLSNVIGVMPAAAEISPKQRTREMAADERAAQREQLAATVQVAEGGKTSADEHVKLTTDLAHQAKNAIRKARKEADRYERAARKAARTADRAADRFKDLTRKMAKIDVEKLDAAELEKQSAEELAEETKVLDLARDARAARALAAKKKRAIKKAIVAAAAAEKVRKIAREDAKTAKQTLADAKQALAAAELIEARKDYPVSVFISSKTGRLVAKLGFKEVIDVPVTIADPEQPLGTHVLTATAFKDGETALAWSEVTLNPPSVRSHPPRRKRRRHDDETFVAPAGQDADAATALARIEIPKETREQLAELMKPGSSFIISDYPLSRETSERTEFVVEPWRARRHEENREYSYD